jgi:MerR family transcriptional regulator, light-induced transcriptional regulator
MAKVSPEDWSATARPLALQLLDDASSLPSEKRAELLSTISEQIVPELLASHWQDLHTPEACADGRVPPTALEVDAFVRIARRQDLPGALAFVEELVRQGLSLESILLHLVPPAARQLGDEWLADVTSWAEVTAALGTLHQVVHVFGPEFAPAPARRGPVVLVAAPGEQHTLGLYLLGEFLRRDGWDAHVDPGLPAADLVAFVESQHVAAVGISVSNDELLGGVERLVLAVKRASCNPRVAVLLGGPLDLGPFAARLDVASFCDPREVVRWLDGRADMGYGGAS